MSEHVLSDTFFESLDLHPLLQQGLADCGFVRCTPIQALTLPVALKGRDVAGQAQTGTGKTCAFLVAMMNRLLTQPAMAERKDSDPRALVIAPTRELAIQIDKDARAIGRHTGLRTALIYGGVDYDKQRQQLHEGCDIIIATPGRLLDYYKQHVFSFNSVEVMVIDEADRMFDLGFIKDVRYIFRRLPAREQRQVLLFSATLSHRVLELAYEHMNEAEKLAVETDNVTADRVKQVVYFPAREEKMPLLLNLMTRHQPQRSIIFANTKAEVERLTERLKRHGYKVGALSGDVPQVKRQKLLSRFQDGQVDVLVATDVAARGLHIPAVSHVFNYDLPQDAEDYVHRIGRTARLGAEGDAISFACDLYAISLPDIEAYIEQKIPVEAIDPELLVMPKPQRVEAVAEEDADLEDGAENASSADTDESARKPRRRRRRSGSGASEGAASMTHAAAESSASTEASAGSNRPEHESKGQGGSEAGAPRKRRRRRGGRGGAGRAAGEGQAAAGGTSSGQRGERSSEGRRERRGPRDGEGNRGGRARQGGASRPAQASTPAKPDPAPAKPRGLLKRIVAALFGGK